MATNTSIIDFLNSPTGGILYPVTLVEGVYNLDGDDLPTILDGYLPLSGGTMTGSITFDGSVVVTETDGNIIIADPTTFKLQRKNTETKSFIKFEDGTLDIGVSGLDAENNELSPQNGDAIVFEYYDNSIGDYDTTIHIDGLTGNISVYKDITSYSKITASQFESTTPISITIGNCTKQWDGCSPLNFTLEEIGIDTANLIYRANANS